ncbi:DNA-binding domain-containing protein [Parendozoicomonas sp. Alg238-R29]|uniref:HvfC/BufC N-terminal domain-containing protein n=1 Tax=Parendozoicomonas sp. Alg238-R29 TaxID=2993446 RepID=UPI00248ED405|nr:DNA-binding domain-containing protein [Parendozoicomonas sp. Alg238-R29]
MNYQPLLMDAIASQESHSDFDRGGLEIYQRNLLANAARSLSLSYPTVEQLVGEDSFKILSRDFIAVTSPTQGDWAEWGESFPRWLADHSIADMYPYIPDCAALDWQHHQCERAGNTQINTESFQLLAEEEAENGLLLNNSTLKTVTSEYPIFDIWMAHHGVEDLKQKHLAQAKEKLDNKTGQTVLIWRKQWKVHIKRVLAPEKEWVNLIRNRTPLGLALETIQNEPFAFESWLPEAISEHLITEFQLTTHTDT